ncbi:MAG: DUF4175 domain-containing protein [Isosphaeraceae bacterium]|nr:DUF4175 domain-containing protein [Isosphaeraceae bacterium]
MRSPLEARIAALRGRVRRLLALHGLSWVVAAGVLAVIVAGLADWIVPGHLASEVRLVLLVGILGLVGWLTARYVIRPLVVRFRDLDIALRIEQRWPGLNDRLTSTVQFLALAGQGDRDDLFGSKALREATIEQTLKETEAIDFREVVDPKPARRALLSAAVAIGLGVVFLVAAPGLSRIALARLFTPFGSTQWPKQTHLQIVQAPQKIARGEEFRLLVGVAEGERAPSTAKVTYRFEDGDVATEPLRPDDRNRFHGRIEAVSRPFTFSVAAGDDVTAPRRVEVVPPPSLQRVTVKLIAPAYTGLAPQIMAPGRTQFPAVKGTKVEITATANKPIAHAELHRGDGSTTLPVTLDQAGKGLSAALTVEESGPFWFALRDTEGFRSQEKDTTRFEIRALKDEAPRVVIDEPPNDRDVTPQATVPVQITADDDYGLGRVQLHYKVATGGSEPTKVDTLPLWAAEADARPIKRQEVPHIWDIAALNLAPGAVVTFYADARDLDTISGPKVGKSRELRLRVVAPEEIIRQLDDQRREIRDEIARVLEMQKQAQTPVQDALRTLKQTDQLDAAKRDDLRNAGVIQRQVGNRVTSRSDGLDQKIRRFLDDLKNQKIDNPEVRQQMEEMRSGVERIREQHLGPAEQNLTRASKALDDAADGAQPNQPAGKPQEDQGDQAPKADNGPKPQAADQATGKADPGKAASRKAEEPQAKAGSKPQGEPPKGERQPSQPEGRNEAAKNALAEAGEQQKAIADELARMLESLKEFDTFRGVVSDAKKLLKEHEELMKQAADAAKNPELTGKPADALSPQQKADLENLGARQAALGKELQQLENKMEEMANRVAESDPMGASALQDAAKQSRSQGTAAKMNETANQLGKNQMGSAQANQKQAQQELKKMIDTLQNRREYELAKLVKELKEAEKALKDLKGRQAKNLAATNKAKQNPNAQQRKEDLQKLAKEQEEIEKELKKQLQKLQKLRADRAAQAGSRAASKMSKAQQDLDQDDADDAAEQEEDALADLQDAENDVRQARREAEEQLAMEQLSKMADSLKALGERQDKIVEETADYQAKQTDGKKLTRAQQAGVRGLARTQDVVKDETEDLASRLDQAPVFALTLKRAAESMAEAARRLQDLKTDADTQRAEKSAANRFKQLQEALKPDKAKGNRGQGNPGGGGGGGGGGGDGITTAAQIKLLKALQEELNDRTEELDQLRHRPEGLKPEQEAELARLQDDQRNIADLARDLTKPKRDDGEED